MNSGPSDSAGQPRRRLLILAAHPDDETVGAFALARSHETWVLHLTDGAPRDPRLWGDTRAPERDGYARERRREAEQALARCGVPAERILSLNVPDQEAVQHLPELVARTAEVLRRVRPARVIAQPYEGGHPDHDAVALVARAALALSGPRRPRLFEMTAYHHRDGALRTYEFLPAPARTWTWVLSPAERVLKQEALDCFRTQRAVLSLFPVAVERYRAAPPCDFSAPPHEGALHYERQGWSEGAAWRDHAVRALRSLSLASRLA